MRRNIDSMHQSGNVDVLGGNTARIGRLEAPTDNAEEAPEVETPEEPPSQKIPAITLSGAWQQALTAAETGPELQRLLLLEHHWNIKPLEIVKIQDQTGSKVTIAGRISHNVRLQIDDQIDFVMVFENEALTKAEMTINEGGILGLSIQVLQALDLLDEPTIALGNIEELIAKFDNQSFPEWQDAAEVVIAKLSLAIYQRQMVTTD